MKLAGEAADAFKFLPGENVHAGVFDTSLLPEADILNPWTVFGKSGEDGFSFTKQSLLVNFSVSNGTWSVKNISDENATLDLILAIHAGNGAGAFLFDDQAILAGQELTGTWAINWYNNDNNTNNPGFSNFAFFQRDLSFVDEGGGGANEVPEPGSLALLGLGILGMSALRKRRKA